MCNDELIRQQQNQRQNQQQNQQLNLQQQDQNQEQLLQQPIQQQNRQLQNMELPGVNAQLYEENDFVVMDTHARLRCHDELLNIPGRRDSVEMTAVKNAIKELQTVSEVVHDLSTDEEVETFFQKLDEIEKKYMTAIDKCNEYIKIKDSYVIYYYNKVRYQAVKNTREMLEKEIGNITRMRQLKDEFGTRQFIGASRSFLDMSDEYLRNENLAANLELRDYVKVSKGDRDDLILCRNGKLYKKDANEEDDVTSTATKENYQMARQFIELILKKQTATRGEVKERIIRNMLYSLGADVQKQKSVPIHMSDVRSLLRSANFVNSKVDSVLADKNADELSMATAQQIDRLLGKSFLGMGRNENFAPKKKALKRQLRDIRTSKLSDADMDFLLNGGIETVRDRVYDTVMRIYKDRARLGCSAVAIDDDEVKQLLKIAVAEAIAPSTSHKAVQTTRLHVIEEDLLLQDMDLATLKQGLNNTRIEELAYFSARHIREYILSDVSHLQGTNIADVETKQNIMNALSTIVENMRKLMTLEDCGMRGKLSDIGIQHMLDVASKIDNAYLQNTDNIQAFKATLGENTVLRVGLDRLIELYEGETSFRRKCEESLAPRFRQLRKNRNQDDDERESYEKKQTITPEYNAARDIIDTLDERPRRIAQLFIRDIEPYQLIKRSGNRFSKDLMNLHDALAGLEDNGSVNVTVDGVALTFTQEQWNQRNILTLHIGGKRVVVSNDSAYWTQALEGDICTYFDKYEKVSAKKLLKGVALRGEKGGTESRANYERFLTNHLYIEAEDMNNLSSAQLRMLIAWYCDDVSEEEIKRIIKKNINVNEVHINSKTALENLAILQEDEQAFFSVFKNNHYKAYFGSEEEQWTPENQQILTFIGELFFSNMEAQGNKEFGYNPQRLKKAIKNNLEGFHAFRRSSAVLRQALLSRFQLMPGFDSAITAITNLMNAIDAQEQKTETVKKKEYIFFGDDVEVKEKVAKSDEEVNADLESGALNEILNANAPALQAAVDAISKKMQEKLSNSVNDLQEESDDGWKGLLDYKISELLRKNMSGQEGEGAFNMKVLKGYIEQASQADKQNMVAAVFKYAPNIKNIWNMSEDEKDLAAGKYIAAYLKGAGPLMHKMLQGLPISSMPPMMQAAVKDVRSNLAPIDEKIVDAQLANIVKESNGTITKIEKLRILGAASVGETLLVRVYGAGDFYGTEKVVKLLRPDVQNHLNRELVFMENCAKEVDAEAFRKANPGQQPPENYVGGMLKTYRNKIVNIKKELDLRLEADNAETGMLYEDELLNIHSMKVDKRTKKMTGALMLEKAEGVTIDKYISKMDTAREEIIQKYGKEGVSTYDLLNELDSFKEKLKVKQRLITSMARKWLDEALFKSGYFHGDLHSGNAMIGENGVTIIDYGNAGSLTSAQRSGLINLMAAAACHNPKRFRKQLEKLLEGEGKAKYASKKQALDAKMRILIKKDTKNDHASSADAIMVVFTELQKEGIEIPAGIYNFMQSFIRVIGTLVDYDALVDKVDENMVSLMTNEENEDLATNPEGKIYREVKNNILSRYEKKYKKYSKNESLADCISRVTKIATTDTSNLFKFCREKTENSTILLSECFAKPFGDQGAFIMEQAFGSETASKYMYKLRYDRRLTPQEVNEHMRFIVAAMKKSLEDKNNEIQKKKRILKKSITNLEAKKAELIADKADFMQRKNISEEEREAAIVGIESILKTMEKAKNKQAKELQDEINKMEKGYLALQSKIGTMLDTMSNTGEHNAYTRDTAIRALDGYIDACRDSLLTLTLADEEEKEYIRAAFALAKTTAPSQRENEDEGNKYVDLELDKRDTNTQATAQARSQKALDKIANKIYRRTQTKSYNKMLSEAIIDEKKFAQLGQTINKWCEQGSDKQLQTAYNETRVYLDRERQEGRQPKADSEAVIKFVSEMIKAMSVRFNKIDALFKKKNTKDETTDMNAMVKGLLKHHWYKSLASLDGAGIFYLFEHPYTEDQQTDNKKATKNNHTEYVRPLYNAIEEARFPRKLMNLKKVNDLIHNANQEENAEHLTQAKDQMNDAINAIIVTFSKLPLKTPGKKLFKSLVDAYEQKPTCKTFTDILSGMQDYILSLFEGTAFMDHAQAEDGKNLPSLFENVYNQDLGNNPFRNDVAEVVKFKCDEAQVMDANGNQLSLYTRIMNLQEGQKLEWIKK